MDDSINPSYESLASVHSENIFDRIYLPVCSARKDLYEKSKKAQWNAADRLDWSSELDGDNFLSFDDRLLPIFGSRVWGKLGESDKTLARQHHQAYTLAQFLHGEQAALIACGRLIQCVPSVLSKQNAAMQATDEARHVEIFQRLIHDKVRIQYPMDAGVKSLLGHGLASPHWDYVVLTTQILIEGLALGVLQQMRDFSKNPFVVSVAAYVMADEARHVGFGIRELETYYAELSDSELDERAEFALEGLELLQHRLNPKNIFDDLGFSMQGEEPDGKDTDFRSGLASRLSVRLRAMLDKLGLTDVSQRHEARKSAVSRLDRWFQADERALETSQMAFRGEA